MRKGVSIVYNRSGLRHAFRDYANPMARLPAVPVLAWKEKVAKQVTNCLNSYTP